MKVLLLNPSKWGRGITPIWIASHTAVLKLHGHDVALFDATFFRPWTVNENAFNTENQQYKPSAYDGMIRWNEGSVVDALQVKIDEFNPDIIFWSAISSHIHGEGEYVAIELGAELLAKVKTTARFVAGGLQATADRKGTEARFPIIDDVLTGETEFQLAELADGKQPAAGNLIPDLDLIGPYDYSLFDDQIFLRPYNGEVIRAVDYELSRGCLFTCSYCVETVIQRHYGFTETTPRGALKRSGYLRHKSAGRVMEEITSLHRDYGVTLFRCQDTNFLTIDRKTLSNLADIMDSNGLPIRLYIETRPEGINEKSIELLKRLKVDGVGMGIELAGQSFRESKLNRFADQEAIERAFGLLREARIRRTAYNVIGFPDQDEDSIKETIAFNRRLDPDNVTVAFYTPYLGTGQQQRGAEIGQFLLYEPGLDSQLITASRIEPQLMRRYKRDFVAMVRKD